MLKLDWLIVGGLLLVKEILAQKGLDTPVVLNVRTYSLDWYLLTGPTHCILEENTHNDRSRHACG